MPRHIACLSFDFDTWSGFAARGIGRTDRHAAQHGVGQYTAITELVGALEAQELLARVHLDERRVAVFAVGEVGHVFGDIEVALHTGVQRPGDLGLLRLQGHAPERFEPIAVEERRRPQGGRGGSH